MTIDDVAGRLKSGAMQISDVEIQYIVRDGNTLILNTRSAQALERAGIPKWKWNAVDMTGDPGAERRLSRQLRLIRLDNQGFKDVRSKGGSK